MDKKDPKDQKYQLSLALEQLKNSDEKIKASLTSSDPEVDYICLRNLLSNIKAMEKTITEALKYLNGIDIHKTLTRTLNKLNSDLYNYWQFISSAVDFLVNPNAPRDPYATEQMNNRLGEIDATTQKILSAIDGLKYVQLLSDTKKHTHCGTKWCWKNKLCKLFAQRLCRVR